MAHEVDENQGKKAELRVENGQPVHDTDDEDDEEETDETGRPSRLKYFDVTTHGLQSALTTGNRIEVLDGVPRDAKIVDAGYDRYRQTFYLTLEHDSFDLVHEGEDIPSGECTIKDLPRNA